MGAAPDISRRNLLRGRPGAAAPIRPPGALPGGQFLDACSGCGKCLQACPELILVSGDGGYPEIDFSRGECTFCAQCIDACPDKALSAASGPVLAVTLQVSDRCLPRRNVVCMTCADACPEAAIRFPPRLGGPPEPVVDRDACSGCGACVAACPERAIEASPRD